MRSTIFMAVSLIITLAVGGAERIEVFTDAHYPVTGLEVVETQGVRVTVYDFAAPTVLEAELSSHLPADPGAAADEARRRLEALGVERLRKNVEAAFAAQQRALDYGLTRYPAIVIDGKALIYGLTDLPEALARYRAWRAKRQ